MLTARALYSNVSESPDELSFNEGDVLAVLQKDVNGLSGWWLCLIDGRLGLAPGNRLKVNARRVESDAEDDMRPLEPDDSKRTHVVKRFQQSDSNDSRQIYDVPPPAINSSSSLPLQNTSDKSHHETVYDVPPSSKTTNHDKLRKVEFAGETEYQDPRPIRNKAFFSHKTTTPSTARQLRSVPPRDTTGPAGETLPDSSGKNLSEDGGNGGRMGSVVRVCVEDDDDQSSEDAVTASARTPRGLNDGDLRAEPENRATTGPAAEEEEKTGRLSSAKRLAFYDPWSTGKAATLPRRFADGGTTGQSDELGTITNRDYADQKSSRQSSALQFSSSLSSRPPCTVGHPKVYGDREPFTDNYYSVPAKWMTLPSPRYRRSSDSIGRQQQLFRPDFLGPVDRPMSPPKEALRPRSAGSDDQEYHLSFVDASIVADCPRDPRSVSQAMESLQQTVRCRTGVIRDLCLGFDLSSAGSDARRTEADAAQMRACCRSLRAALREFADLGTGVLANAMQSPSRDMSENILQQLESLHVSSQDLENSVESVVIASRGDPMRRGSHLRDALNSLLVITQDIVRPLDSLTYLVAKNSAVIFSAGRALPPPPPPGPGFPAIMDIRSPSSPSLPALPGTARELNFLPPNILTSQALSPYSIVEMRPGSPNILFIQNPSPGNPFHGRVARDGKTGATIAVQSPDVFRSLSNYRSSSPTPTLQTLPLHFRPAASSLPPRYSQTSYLPTVGLGPMVDTEPERPGPRRYVQTRPLLQLPFENEGAIGSRSNDETVDWKSVEDEYSSIADEAERDMKRNVGVLVDRLMERSGAGSFQFLPSNGSDSYYTPPTNLASLNPPHQKERMEAATPDDQTGYASNNFLSRIDREIVRFYVEEVRSHCDDVRFVADDLLGALVDGSTAGNDLVMTLSRQIVRAAHKLLFAGDAIAKKFASDEELKSHVGSVANDLGIGLKRTLVASKAAAAPRADGNFRRQEMIDCVNRVKFLSVKLRDLISAYVFDRIE